MADNYHYPELCIGCIKEVVDIIRNGQISERRQEFALDVWVTEGAILNILIGEPDTPQPVGLSPEMIGALHELENVAVEKQLMAKPEGAVPWLLLLKLLLEFLSHLDLDKK